MVQNNNPRPITIQTIDKTIVKTGGAWSETKNLKWGYLYFVHTSHRFLNHAIAKQFADTFQRHTFQGHATSLQLKIPRDIC